MDKWVIDKQHPFDSAYRMEISNGEAKFWIHNSFQKYLAKLTKRDQEKVNEEMVDQTLSKEEMKIQESHPFYIDKDGFEMHCKVKYKFLHDHILRWIDEISR